MPTKVDKMFIDQLEPTANELGLNSDSTIESCLDFEGSFNNLNRK